MCVCVFVYMFMHIYPCMYVYISIHIYIHECGRGTHGCMVTTGIAAAETFGSVCVEATRVHKHVVGGFPKDGCCENHYITNPAAE